MLRKQRGITLIGWLFLLLPLVVCGYAALRLVPIYLNYTKVVRTMDQVASDVKADELTQTAIRNSLNRRLDIESIEFPDGKDFVIRRDGQQWIMEVSYEDAAPLMSNLQLVATFKKTVTIGKGGGG